MIYLNKGKEIIKKINNNGYEAYIVGGAVRDYLLKAEVNDIDITTNMPLEEIAKLFVTIDGTSKLYEGVTIVYENEQFEVTHFRKESGYLDHRHPIVEATDSLEEDLIRRDFTINALLMDYDGNIIDKFNGIDDLNKHIIRTINNPYDRFLEDALRILRACYFAGKLGFEIEDNAKEAMKKLAYTLDKLSLERIYEYLVKIIQTDKGNAKYYINELNIFNSLPAWQKWLNINDLANNINSISLCYYRDYLEYPPYYLAADKKYFKAIFDVKNNNFDNYSLYNTYKYKDKLIPLFKDLDLNNKYDSLVIKDSKELALSTLVISSKFEGTMKGKAIEMVIKAILDKKIKNEAKAILDFLAMELHINE